MEQGRDGGRVKGMPLIMQNLGDWWRGKGAEGSSEWYGGFAHFLSIDNGQCWTFQHLHSGVPNEPLRVLC